MNAQQILETRFGFTTFRPGQKAVIQALHRHRAALAVFPTGGGKSLCYQLPALFYEGTTLVVSPLIALMKDQIDFLTARGIPAARIDSSLESGEARRVTEQVREGTVKILYVAPERFNNERFLGELKRLRIALFAIDEAHCISEWGHNFRPDYLKLAATARDVGAARVLTLTATATPAVVEDICAAFTIPAEASIVTGFYRHNLSLCTSPVTADLRDAVLLERLASRSHGPTIVYVTLQKTAERLAADLSAAGYPARAYHAGMETVERTAVQEAWMASDRGIVVATIAFGMGIDKSDVRYVYHYNLPKSLESYSQEIGRAGRDGVKSTVEMLACPDDVPTLLNFAYGDTPSEAALRSLVEEVIDLGAEFDVSLYDLADRHDIRPLVLKTALTYLELAGLIRQGTPFYAGCQFRLLQPLDQVLAAFPGEPGKFLNSVIRAAKAGRTWYSLNPDEAALALGRERRRIVRALEVLEERGLAELRLSDSRQRYTRLDAAPDVEALVRSLNERFVRREAQERERMLQVLSLVERDGCQTNALVGYFGEQRGEPCGHCTHCVTRRRQQMPASRTLPPLPAGLAVAEFAELRLAHPAGLGEARQAARFLCGLTSPALTKAKLGRHPLFGTFAERDFLEVLEWCSSQPAI